MQLGECLPGMYETLGPCVTHEALSKKHTSHSVRLDDILVIKSICCSCKKSGFGSYHLHRDSQLPVPNLTPSSGLHQCIDIGIYYISA